MHSRWTVSIIAAIVVLLVGAGVTYSLARHSASRCSPLPRVTTGDSGSASNIGGDASISELQQSSDQLVPPPAGSTGNATAITDSSARLHGSVTPNGEDTQVYFEYGQTADSGMKTKQVEVGSKHTTIPTSTTIAGLAANTTYQYVEIIETRTHLLYGSDQCFVTNTNGFSPATSTLVPTAAPATEPPTR
jgi:hypothetical protein